MNKFNPPLKKITFQSCSKKKKSKVLWFIITYSKFERQIENKVIYHLKAVKGKKKWQCITQSAFKITAFFRGKNPLF